MSELDLVIVGGGQSGLPAAFAARRARLAFAVLESGEQATDRPDLRYLQPTGALSADGSPVHRAGVSTAVPGLGFVGLEFQRSIASATGRGVGRDAAHVVGRLIWEQASVRRGAWALRGRGCATVAR